MKYLITGGNGFVGKALKGNLSSKNNHLVKTLGLSKTNDYIIDLSSKHLSIQEEFDVIIHTASIVHNYDHASKFDSELILKDILITKNLLKSIRQTNYKKLVFLSSVAVYGIEEGSNIDILNNLKPNNGYGLSKAVSEILLLSALPAEKILILRLPLINGPHPKGNILKAKKALENNQMVLFKQNRALKSILEIEDLIDFIEKRGLSISGIQQLKSYDLNFNQFIESLSTKKPKYLPFYLLSISKKFASLFRLRRIYSVLNKISSSLTFKNSIREEKNQL